MRSTVVVRSILVEPMTPMRGRRSVMLSLPQKPVSSSKVALRGKSENRLEKVGDLGGSLLARFRVASHGDAALRAALELCGGGSASIGLPGCVDRQGAGVQINLALTIAQGRWPQIEMRGRLGVEGMTGVDINDDPNLGAPRAQFLCIGKAKPRRGVIVLGPEQHQDWRAVEAG